MRLARPSNGSIAVVSPASSRTCAPSVPQGRLCALPPQVGSPVSSLLRHLIDI